MILYFGIAAVAGLCVILGLCTVQMCVQEHTARNKRNQPSTNNRALTTFLRTSMYDQCAGTPLQERSVLNGFGSSAVDATEMPNVKLLDGFVHDNAAMPSCKIECSRMR